jgi:hypothetical protein
MDDGVGNFPHPRSVRAAQIDVWFTMSRLPIQNPAACVTPSAPVVHFCMIVPMTFSGGLMLYLVGEQVREIGERVLARVRVPLRSPLADVVPPVLPCDVVLAKVAGSRKAGARDACRMNGCIRSCSVCRTVPHASEQSGEVE